MGLLSDEDKKKIKEKLENLDRDIKILFFTQEFECPTCSETRNILMETSNLSEKLDMEIYDFQKDGDKVKKYGIERIPAIVPVSSKDYGIRFYGIPAGFEYAAFLEALLDVSRGESTLARDIKEKLKAIDKPINIKVFVLPTCPYCPSAVRIAHQFAIENEYIKGEAIEAQEFPDQALKYQVTATPKTIINENIEILGAVPETEFLEKVIEAYKKSSSS